MVDVVTQICADGVRETNPAITEEELIFVLRHRFMFGRKPSHEL